ncbi:MAG: hypothetical protein M1829_004050 [Trizodia sp. TS-e1964]|nr:MAG: hypothetical protein M1829_004050 [Trizodia sp. TS-e1964]
MVSSDSISHQHRKILAELARANPPSACPPPPAYSPPAAAPNNEYEYEEVHPPTPVCISISAPLKIFGDENIIHSTPEEAGIHMARSVLQALQGATAAINDEEGRARPMKIDVNCTFHVVGSRNVLGSNGGTAQLPSPVSPASAPRLQEAQRTNGSAGVDALEASKKRRATSASFVSSSVLPSELSLTGFPC